MIGTPDGVNVSTLIDDPNGPIATFSETSSILQRRHRLLLLSFRVESSLLSTACSASMRVLKLSGTSSQTNRSTRNGKSLSSNASRSSATCALCSDREIQIGRRARGPLDAAPAGPSGGIRQVPAQQRQDRPALLGGDVDGGRHSHVSPLMVW